MWHSLESNSMLKMRRGMSWKLGCVTPGWLCVSPSHIRISAHRSLGLGTSSAFPSVLLLLWTICLLLFLSSVFRHFSPTLSCSFLPIHVFKVGLTASHCISSPEIIKLPLPATLNPVAFSCRHFDWSYFQKSVTFEEKENVLTIFLTCDGVF